MQADPELRDMQARLSREFSGSLSSNDNPWKTISVTPSYYDLMGTIHEFLTHVISGYLWACKHDINFIAAHPEAHRLENLLSRLLAWRAMSTDPDRDEEALYGPQHLYMQSILVEFASVLPELWD